jgi:serine/threonine protein kinase
MAQQSADVETPRVLLKEVLGIEITDQTIGRGSYSKVVLGIEKDTKRKVAVKMTDLKYHRNYYEREVAALSHTSHSNIVRMIAHYEDWTNQIGYLIEEYVRATSLDEYVRKKSQSVGLKEREALRIFEQLLETVSHVHLTSFSHHDLKPDNILYDPLTRTIKLIDFGLSLKMDEDDRVEFCSGTPLYMAPELLHNVGEHNAVKSDVWSLGVILFYLLVGDSPYLNVSSMDVLLSIVDSRSFYMPRFLSKDAHALISSMMTTDPDERPSLSQLLQQTRQLRRKSSHSHNPQFAVLRLAAASQA